MKNRWNLLCRRAGALILVAVVGLAALCPAALAAKAQLPDLPKDQCVVDSAGILNDSTAQFLDELNGQLEASCGGAQIGVLTVDYTGSLSTEEYALEAFNTWGIGSRDKNNGVLILLVMESPVYEDGDYYLTYGDGFRNTVLERQASTIAQTMEDDFANQNYDSAVRVCAQNTANLIAEQVYGVSLGGGSGGGASAPQGQKLGFADVINLIVVGFLGLLFFVILIGSVFRIFIAPIGRGLFGWFWGPFGWFVPRGPRRPRPPRPPHNDFHDFHDRHPPRPPRGGGFGGGGFGGMGGFGGGGFGGMGGGGSHGGGGGRGR